MITMTTQQDENTSIMRVALRNSEAARKRVIWWANEEEPSIHKIECQLREFVQCRSDAIGFASR